MGWSISGGILYPPTVTPPAGATPVSAPPPAAAAPTTAASGSDGLDRLLKHAGLFSGLAGAASPTADAAPSDGLAANPFGQQSDAINAQFTPGEPTRITADSPQESYDDWYNSRLNELLGGGYGAQTGLNKLLTTAGQYPGVQNGSQFTGPDDPMLKRQLAGELLGLPGGVNPSSVATDVLKTGSSDPYGALPYDLTPDDVLNYFKDAGGWQYRQSAYDNNNQALDFGGQLAQFAAVPLGGPVGGSIAAANLSGATTDMGLPKWLQAGAQIGGTLFGGGPPSGTPASAGAKAAGTAAANTGMLADVPTWLQNAGKGFGMGFLTSGGDIGSAVKGGALGGALPAAADVATPYINSAVNSFNGGSINTADATPSQGMLPAAPDAPSWLQSRPTTLSGPSSVVNPDGSVSYVGDAAAASRAGLPWQGQSITDSLGGAVPIVAGASSVPLSSIGATPDAAPPLAKPQPVSSDDVQRFAKAAAQLLGGDAKGPTPPAADAPPEEQQKYYSDIVSYLGLDAQTMADSGFTPGTPEYTQYILDQADTIINGVMQGLDVNSADLSAQLRTKTDQELQQLQRALYVRGQLGQKMGAGSYVDPFTGKAQDVIGAGTFDPNTAAYQRGLAGSVDQLGGMRGQGAYDYLRGMLGRNSDLFGMQGAADERFQQALRNDQNPDEQRRRRGMLPIA